MPIFYNPEVRPDLPKILQGPSQPIDPKYHNFYKKRAYASKAEAAKRNFSGYAIYWEDGELRRCVQVGSFDCKPVTKTTQPVKDPGMNWCSAYFVDEESAEAFTKSLTTRYDGPVQRPEYGVWFVMYHY